MKKVLITGAYGNLGKSIPDIRGFEIIRTGRERLDITDYEAVERFCSLHKPEIIIHLASLVGNACNDEELAMKVNVEASVKLFKVAQKYGLEKFIFTSTSAVYNQKELKPTKEDENIDPQNFYGKSKLLAEEELMKINKCNLIIFRIFNLYGEGFDNSLVNKLLKEEKNLTLYKNFYRDYIHVSDVVKFIQKALVKDLTGIFNLGSGISRNVEDLLGEIGLDYELEDRFGTFTWADIMKLQRAFDSTPSQDLKLR